MRIVSALTLVLALSTPAIAGPLDEQLGRTEVRITSAPYPLVPGRTVGQAQLPQRLERLGYTRVKHRPSQPGEYFWGRDTFWIYRQTHRAQGRSWDAALIGLRLGNDAIVVSGIDAKEQPLPLDGRRGRWLEPEVLAESLDGDRAMREPIAIGELPDHVWQPLLALEDARFRDHIGVDSIAIARALLANVRKGGVSEGGSTITQQLVKNRDLTPKRTLDRKASEAARALAIEAEYSKDDILEAYLNIVYYGHVDGVAIHGIGAASRVYFDKPAHELTLAEAATLAAVVQGPNALSPIKHPDRAQERRDRALDRMIELGWVAATDAEAAKAQPVVTHRGEVRRFGSQHLRAHVASHVGEVAAERTERGLGFAAETTVDPLLQAHAEKLVADHLAALRKKNKRLRDGELQAALVAVDARSGAVLAHVGGDPEVKDSFDRATRAQRQPGSTVKPFVALEAFERCGDGGKPLNPATRLADDALSVQLDGSTWNVDNYDGKNHGIVSARTAITRSYNRPVARMALHCGIDATSSRMARAGLPVPEDPPPSIALGSVELTPMQLAGAYVAFVDLGRAAEPYSVARIERPGGGKIERQRGADRLVSKPGSAFLVRQLLDDAVDRGTGRGADVRGLDVIGKTGTSSGGRDAWFAGAADNVVVVVWVGMDEGTLGMTGGAAAAPIFRDFIALAAPAYPSLRVEQPFEVVVKSVNPENGLRVGAGRDGAVQEYFRRGAQPRKDEFWRRDPPELVIR